MHIPGNIEPLLNRAKLGFRRWSSTDSATGNQRPHAEWPWPHGVPAGVRPALNDVCSPEGSCWPSSRPDPRHGLDVIPRFLRDRFDRSAPNIWPARRTTVRCSRRDRSHGGCCQKRMSCRRWISGRRLSARRIRRPSTAPPLSKFVN